MAHIYGHMAPHECLEETWHGTGSSSLISNVVRRTQKLTADLQGQLNIDVQKKMRWWSELLAAKREGTLAPK